MLLHEVVAHGFQSVDIRPAMLAGDAIAPQFEQVVEIRLRLVELLARGVQFVVFHGGYRFGWWCGNRILPVARRPMHGAGR